MKRKAVVRLLAGTLCTATMAGSILPDTAVAYAKENPVGTVETATQEETSDTVLAADKENEAETPENTTDPVDSAQEKEDPTAIDMEAKEEKRQKIKRKMEKQDRQIPRSRKNSRYRDPAVRQMISKWRKRQKRNPKTAPIRKKRKREMIHEQNRMKKNLRWRKSLMKDTLLPARPIMTF